MIAKLTGKIDSIFEDACIVDVNGVGYLVSASSKTLSKLRPSELASLLIETVVREDSISLFGFFDAWEKEWFLTLTKVQGVGAKVALNILSALTPLELSQAVSAQDKNLFLRAAGIGPKLAARLVTELKDKVVTIPLGVTPQTDNESENLQISKPQNADSSVLEDVISALVNLGYQRIDAYKAASNVYASNTDKPVSELIRLSLKEFLKGGI